MAAKMKPNIFLIPVNHHPSVADGGQAIIGAGVLSGLAETTQKNPQRDIGYTGPIVTIQSVALKAVGIISSAAGVPPTAGATDVVISLSDQLTPRR